MNFVDEYTWLFNSLVIYCSIILFYYVFIVNDKSQKINKENSRALRTNEESEHEKINDIFNIQQDQLFIETKKIVFVILLVQILANIILMSFIYDFKIMGIIGGLIFPIIAFFTLMGILIIAIGLKGQKVLNVGGLIHGR